MRGEPKPPMRQEDTTETAGAENVVMLRNQEEMLSRLLEVDNNVSFRKRFYPLLLEQFAGKTLSEVQIVGTLMLAIESFAEKEGAKLAHTRAHENALAFIDALVVDPKIAAEIKTLWPKAVEFFDNLEQSLKTHP